MVSLLVRTEVLDVTTSLNQQEAVAFHSGWQIVSGQSASTDQEPDVLYRHISLSPRDEGSGGLIISGPDISAPKSY